MSTISFFEGKKIEIKAALDEELKRHDERVKALRYELAEAEKQAELLLGGMDLEKIHRAEHVIAVHGLYVEAGSEKGAAMEAAISALLKGGGILFHEYVGTKDYGRWHGQFISCGYGYGPSHGSRIFSIELTQPVRKQDALTPEQIDDAVYYLRNLERIQDAQQKAKQAANINLDLEG